MLPSSDTDASDNEQQQPLATSGDEVVGASRRQRNLRILAGAGSLAAVACSTMLVASWPHWWLAIAPRTQPPPGTFIAGGTGLTKANVGEATSLSGSDVYILDPEEERHRVNKDECTHVNEYVCCNSGEDSDAHSTMGFDCGPFCFPGDATVDVLGRGPTKLAELRVGDSVLVGRGSGWTASYEPVLTFLHAVPGGLHRHAQVSITHSSGEFRASPSHIVFVAGPEGKAVQKQASEVRVGNELYVLESGGGRLSNASTVREIHSGFTEAGMFAPMTAAGTVVVDGVLASQYAVPAAGVRFPHSAVHAALFLLRAYHEIGLAAALEPLWAFACAGASDATWVCHGDGQASRVRDEMNPFVRALHRHLPLEKLSSVLP